MPLFNTPVMALVQSSVEPKFMGRVMSVFTMVNSAMMPLAMLVFGPLADSVGIGCMLVVAGIAIAFLSVSLLSSKVLRNTGGVKV